MGRPLRTDVGLNRDLLDLLARGGPSWATALSKATGYGQPVVTAAIRRLAAAGFVEVAAEPDERGRRTVALTATGAARLRKDRRALTG